MYICYTDCDSGQRYMCSASACVLSFDPAVIAIVLANLECTAQHAEADGAHVASQLEDRLSPEGAASVRDQMTAIGKSADRALRRSRIKAQAFIQTGAQRLLVHDVRETPSFHEAMVYTKYPASERAV